MRKILLAMFFLVTFVSCQDQDRRPLALKVPASLATKDDNQEIQKTISEIQSIADKIRLQRDFSSFPIVIVDKYPGPLDNVAAFCQQAEDGGGVYIGIIKEYFDHYIKEIQPKYGNAFLYILLVHEIGHCFYNRGHEETRVRVPGKNIFFQRETDSNEYDLISGELPVSAMSSEALSLLSGHFMPEGVKEYFLAEIAGGKRWQNQEDLESTDGIKLIRP